MKGLSMDTNKYKTESNENWVYLMQAVDIINDTEVREFIKGFLVEETPDYFAKIPASATGRYHPAFSLGTGGLIRHTIAAAAIAWDMCKLEYLKASSYDRDLIYGAILIHDTFKQGETESGYTVRRHPVIAAQHVVSYAKKVNFDQRTGNLLAHLVLAHMGEWGNNKPGNRMQFLVHLADFLSSRRYINVDWKDWLANNGR